MEMSIRLLFEAVEPVSGTDGHHRWTGRSNVFPHSRNSDSVGLLECEAAAVPGELQLIARHLERQRRITGGDGNRGRRKNVIDETAALKIIGRETGDQPEPGY